MKEEKDSKRAWMGVLADYYDVDGKEKKLIENAVMEKWRNLHYYGRREIVKEMLDIREGNVFLDCGCGTGRFLTEFERACLTIGVDISNKYCHISRRKAPNSLIIQGDIEYLPLKDESVDVCVMVYTFVYVPNKAKALKEIHRVLKRDGKLVIFDPNRLGLRNFLRNLQMIKRKMSGERFSPSDINRLLVTSHSLNIFGFKKMASEVGLKCDSWRGNFDTIPFPMFKKGFLGKVTIFLFWEKLGCRKWGRLPFIRYFSDFLIIRFVKY